MKNFKEINLDTTEEISIPERILVIGSNFTKDWFSKEFLKRKAGVIDLTDLTLEVESTGQYYQALREVFTGIKTTTFFIIDVDRIKKDIEKPNIFKNKSWIGRDIPGHLDYDADSIINFYRG